MNCFRQLFFTLQSKWRKMTHIVQIMMNKTGLQIKTKYCTHCPDCLEEPIQFSVEKESQKTFNFLNLLG